ncbi:MAG TPA: right-handed parallel beta-helix repeat-containing protein, partial [Thermoanaerobaculia bacterium]|nr:right-handed parallel beta-helix repeat-containing protein [Thermoanaerobaculia bacterium]
NSEFDSFYYGATFGHTSNLRVLNNDVHSMEFDGLRFSQITTGLIQGNHLHDMDGTANGGHRDMIQFWTQGDSAPSSNITIRDNDIMMGDGRASQSIFIFNEAVSRGGAGANMYYRNFVIENNHIQNAHPNGITVGEIDGLVVRNNTVVKDPNTPFFSHGFEPRIIVDDDARNVTITGNVTHGVPGSEPGWVISNNRLVTTGYQPGSPTPAPDPAGPGPSPSPSPGGLTGGAGPDMLTGAAAADTLIGGAGNDTLRGVVGNDRLVGGAGRDILMGGTSGDVFDFNLASESVGWARDVVRGGDAGAAFEGVGWAAGDRIDLSGIDANVHAAGNQMFGFGGTGTGRVSVVEMGSSTLVRANTDYDAAFEFELVIEDGGVRAAQYVASDFIL